MDEKRVFGHLSGEIFMDLTHQDGSVEHREYKNIIVDVASELIAVLMSRDGSGTRPYVPGALVLAVGTGASGWDLQNPPAATANLVQLENEIDRNVFSGVTFVNPTTFAPVGEEYANRTNVVEFTTTFGTAEAVGPLVEMGLFGGNGATSPNGGLMINARRFAVLNKPNGSTLTITWRLTF